MLIGSAPPIMTSTAEAPSTVDDGVGAGSAKVPTHQRPWCMAAVQWTATSIGSLLATLRSSMSSELTVYVASLRAEDWPRWLQICPDLPATHKEWLDNPDPIIKGADITEKEPTSRTFERS